MYLQKKITLILVLLLFRGLLYGQNQELNFKTIPEFPNPGDSIIIIYNPTLTNLAKLKDIKANVVFYSKTGQSGKKTLLLQDGDSVWTGKIHVKKTDLGLIISFYSGNIGDIKHRTGYPKVLSGSNNLPIPHGYGTLANVYTKGKDSWNINSNENLAYNFYKTEFILYPNHKRIYYPSFLISQLNLGDTPKEKLLEELNNLCKEGKFSTSDLSNISYLYGKLGDEKARNFYIDLAIKQDTTGLIVQEKIFEDFEKESDILKKFKLFEDLYTTASPDQDILLKMSLSIISLYAAQGKYAELNSFIEKYPNSKTGRDYKYVAAIIESQDITIATEFAIKGYNIAKKNLASLNTVQKIDFSEQADFLGYLLSKQGKYSEAKVYFLEAKENKSFYRRKPNIFNQYMITMMKTNDPNTTHLIDSLFKIGHATEEMKAFLKKTTVNKESKNTFKLYADSIESINNKVMATQVQSKVINQAAPEFLIKDLFGKNILLSDFKGKTVVIDFWATWCKPCIESFPAMQKVIDIYKNDKNVVFLFVNSSENSENRIKKVTNFMNKNGYRFKNYIDEENKAAKVFKLNGFPTKLVVDKLGNIKFHTFGYDNNEASFINELCIMIEKVK